MLIGRPVSWCHPVQPVAVHTALFIVHTHTHTCGAAVVSATGRLLSHRQIGVDGILLIRNEALKKKLRLINGIACRFSDSVADQNIFLILNLLLSCYIYDCLINMRSMFFSFFFVRFKLFLLLLRLQRNTIGRLACWRTTTGGYRNIFLISCRFTCRC